MKFFLKFTLVLIIALGPGCTGKQLITRSDYRNIVEKSFIERSLLAANRENELFSVFKNNLSDDQADALKFLFAFMPLSDLADYHGDFFLANVNVVLSARAESEWGKNIPEDIFLHYVLPPRINNENLDSFRIVFHTEIMNRIKGMNIKEAALEINHWCHEKVAYQPADIRTSAPMSTILSARGRCGEESTFTVAALRTAGIPARQVYTPRWAHTDDNHAWVEIWADGHWYYLGACEPESVLDRGWFTEPARRAMLVHTKSFGAPYGNENSVNIFKNYTDVNNLSKYATVREIFVRVLYADGKPVKNANVDYKLFNYAEFYTLASVPTDQNGLSSFQTGLGDLLIWASSGNDFDYRKISVPETDTVDLVLRNILQDRKNEEFDLNVPPVLSPLNGPSQELVDQNNIRIGKENLIRQNYLDTWIKPDEVKSLADSLKLDSERISSIISRSMGNYKEIRSFLFNAPDSLRDRAAKMLEILPDKDLRDTKSKILTDHLMNCTNLTSDLFIDYILNPRIANEIIAPWRSYFRKNLPQNVIDHASNDPSVIIKHLDASIKIVNDENYYNTPLTPIGVYNLKVSDEESRSIFFVAICRTLGIPSRLEPGRNIPQYYFDDSWHDVFFAGQIGPSGSKGFIKLISSDLNPVPEYYIHFTLARFENGRYNTLEYEFNKKITDFSEELALPPGNYMLVTGNRLPDSRILSELVYFSLDENEHKTIDVKIRKDIAEKKILGSVDLQCIVDLFVNKSVMLNRSGERGSVIIWIEPDKEPTKHIFNDLPKFKGELDKWGGNFLFLTTSDEDNKSFKSDELMGLPANSFFSTDNKMILLNTALKIVPVPDGSLPYIIMVDKKGDVVFTSAGYRIGIGEQIIKQLDFM
jgi:transglutaminase-like putative cysteine protease